MPISVDLKPPFSYHMWPIVVTLLFIVLSLLALFIIHQVRKSMANPKPAPQPQEVKLPLPALKDKYLFMVAALEQRYKEGKIDEKGAYEELSSLTRHFVYDATGIKVQNYTLDEIEHVGMPGLRELVAECYPPEFDPTRKGHVQYNSVFGSIDHARKVVAQWN